MIPYLFSNIPLEDGAAKMTESERDQIDSEAVKYMRLCRDTLDKYKSDGRFLFSWIAEWLEHLVQD